MKDKIFVFLIITLFINSCNSQVNTVDPQISKNISESKKNGFFMKKITVDSTSDRNIQVEEAWLEKTWFYEIHNGKVMKVAKAGSQLCFKLKQLPSNKYNINKLDKWLMEYSVKETYVGISYGLYELSFNDLNVPDIISLDLINRLDLNGNVKDTKVGVLIFKTIE